MESKPPTADIVRISKGERHDLGAAAPLSTRATSLEQGSAGGPLQSSPNLVDHIGSGSTRLAEQLSPCIVCATVAALSVRSRVLVSAGPSVSMARRGCRASCSRLAKCCSKSLVISSIFLSHTSSIFLYTSTSVGWPNPNSSCWGTGLLPSGTASLSFRGMLGKLQSQDMSID